MKLTLSLLGLALCHMSGLSQAPEVSALRFQMNMVQEFDVVQQGLDNLEDPLVDGNVNPSMYYFANFDLSSILDVAKVHVKFGTTSGGQEIGYQTIDFDSVPSYPLSFERVSEHVKIGVGEHPFSETVFCSVYLEMNDGTLTTPILFPTVAN